MATMDAVLHRSSLYEQQAWACKCLSAVAAAMAAMDDDQSGWAALVPGEEPRVGPTSQPFWVKTWAEEAWTGAWSFWK